MSKKDLLERISRKPGGAARSAESAAPARAREGETTTRVSRRVVRRRGRADEPVAAETKPVRRRAVEVDSAPAPVNAEAEAEHDLPVDDYEPVEEPAYEEPAHDEPAVEAHAEEPTPEESPVVEEPAYEEPVVEAAPPAAEPEPEPEPEPVYDEPEDADYVDEAPVEQAAAASQAPEEGKNVPAQPQFVGLGKAVVAPPPGYDPTNPTAWRRRKEAEYARGSGWGNQGGGAPKAAPAAAAPADDNSPRGRRRVADHRDTRGRRAAAPTPPTSRRGRRGMVGEGMSRRKIRRAGQKGQGTVARKAEKMKVKIDNVISVRQLAHEMGVKATEVIREMMAMGQMATITEMLDMETAALVAAEFGYEVENVGFQEETILQHFEEEEEDEDLEPRPPVVTIMGHVDHGKTTLLDAIREARVAAGEAGGITQHIGAYQVEWNGRLITFLDTPGHAAFSEMRARGASVTDIVILVVAADDGVQDQTREAIAHAKAAGVPIVVAVNKMDKIGVSADPIKQRLSEVGLVAEDWGGDTQFVPVSALKREGLEELLESVLLQADILELAANPDRPAEGIVIEAKVERGRGAVASVLVQRGTLRSNDNVVLGAAYGKVRAMVDFQGKRLKEAGPSTPVELFGLNDLPETGDIMSVVKTDKDAKKVADHRAEMKRQAAFGKTGRRTAEDLFAAAAGEEKADLLLVLRADVQGSLEALKGAISQIEIDGTEVRMLHSAVGNITESDVNLVAANGGLLIGFNVRPDAKARRSADAQGVKVELYSVIYDVLDRVKASLAGMVAPEFEAVDKGKVEVRATFSISRIGTVAGCYVLDGKVGRNHRVRHMRDGEQLWEGKISTLKRFKDDVREVSAGYECGIALEGQNDIQEGDIFEVYAMEEVERTF